MHDNAHYRIVPSRATSPTSGATEDPEALLPVLEIPDDLFGIDLR
jgi:hypothetical protein